jgi:hypothetical protein
MSARGIISVLKRLATALIFGVAVAADAGASPVDYLIDLHVTGSAVDYSQCPSFSGIYCNTKVGDELFGHFRLLDDSILSGPDGTVDVPIAHFFVFIPNAIYDQDHPNFGGGMSMDFEHPTNVFEGFGDGCPIGFGCDSPGLVIPNHEVVGFDGFLIGCGDGCDLNFFQFPSVVPNTFATQITDNSGTPVISGTYEIRRVVDEPATMCLLAFAVMCIVLRRTLPMLSHSSQIVFS